MQGADRRRRIERRRGLRFEKCRARGLTVGAGIDGLPPDAGAGVVEQRPLGRQLALLLEPLPHAVAGERERLPQRDPAVLVGVGAGLVERADEVFGEDRLELLRGRVGGRQHHAAAAGKLLQKRKAGAGRVDEDEPPRQQFQEIGPVGRRQIGTDEIEFRVVAVERGAVADEQNQQLIVFGQALPQIGNDALHVLASRFEHALAFLLGQYPHVVRRIAELVAQRRHERCPPPIVFLRVGVAAGRAGDHDRISVAGVSRQRGQQNSDKREGDRVIGAVHRSPHSRRRIHSPESSMMTSSSAHGSCHRSCRSGAASCGAAARSQAGMFPASAARA